MNNPLHGQTRHDKNVLGEEKFSLVRIEGSRGQQMAVRIFKQGLFTINGKCRAGAIMLLAWLIRQQGRRVEHFHQHIVRNLVALEFLFVEAMLNHQLCCRTSG